MDTIGFHSNYVSGMRIEEAFGKHRISCKVGSYCTFGIDQISNQRHSHEVFELCIVISGTGRFIHKDKTYCIGKGDLIIADAGELHEVQSDDVNGMQLLYIFIHITSNIAVTMLKSEEDRVVEKFLTLHQAHISSQSQLITYLEFIENYKSRKGNHDPGIYDAVKNLIIESLSLLSGSTAPKTNKMATQNIIETALDYIDLNLENRVLIKDVANYACTSQRNLEQIFRKHLRKTVKSYINEKKMELSCHYLAMNFTIADAGKFVGIYDAAQFSRLFKKYKGMSPGKYQRLKAPNKQGMARRLL